MSLLFVLGIFGGCGNISSRRSPETAREARRIHQEQIDDLVPEDGLAHKHLAPIVDAMKLVRPDIPKEELRLNSKVVRKVLQGFTTREIDQVKAILPEVIKRRRDEGLD